MSKAVSYYDWELNFNKKGLNQKSNNKKDINSLGIPDNEFKDFMRKWKKKNLT
ncbi:MAG: hypothetical protein ACFFAN_17275 [Promethearchaeota archaeon]